MKLPVNWVKEYIKMDLSMQQLKDLLTMTGLAVDSVETIDGELVFDIDVPANRPDCLSIIGIARELSAATGKPLVLPDVNYDESAKNAGDFVSVEVPASDLCPRYTARVIYDAKIKDSPDWMKKRLKLVGLKPINNIADITNCVLFECGQPLHAFDQRFLSDKKLIIRRAKKGESITAIDGKKYELPADALVIADQDSPVAVAGVIGGKDSEIRFDTSTVIVESALFDPVSIRITSKSLGVATESSYRFERQADFYNVDWASRRVCQLSVQLADAKIAKGVIDVSRLNPDQKKLQLRHDSIGRILGIRPDVQKVTDVLARLGFNPVKKQDHVEVQVPSWRKDITREIDLIEDVARHYGYDKIPDYAQINISLPGHDKSEQVRLIFRDILLSQGYYEVLTWSFSNLKEAHHFNFWSKDMITLSDPRGGPSKILRTSLIPNMLSVIKTNESYREQIPSIFEIAKIYLDKGKKHDEITSLGIVDIGGFYRLKGALDIIFNRISVRYDFSTKDEEFLEPGTGCLIRSNEKVIGYIGLVSERILSDLDIASRNIACCELCFGALVDLAEYQERYSEFSRMPAVWRDLSFIFQEELKWGLIEQEVIRHGGDLLEKVVLIDHYKGGQIPQGQKSITFRLIFRSSTKTLTSQQVEGVIKQVINAMKSRFNATLRG